MCAIPHLGEVTMEAAILAHVHPLGLSFRLGGGQALPLLTVNLLFIFIIANDCCRNLSSTKLNIFLYFCLHNVLIILS